MPATKELINSVTGPALSEKSMQEFLNPNSGKLLGYVYETPEKPNTSIAGLPAYKRGGGENEWTELPFGTPPDLVNENGQGYVVVNPGSENQFSIPIATEPPKMVRSVAPKKNATKIPVYEPPLNFALDGKPLSDEQKFNWAATLAGAGDAKAQKASQGIIDSNYVPGAMRSAIGLPTSFDMLRGIDPTKSDWSLSKARLYNPTSSGVLGDFAKSLADAGPIASIGLALMGVPPYLAGAIMGGSSAYAGNGNIFKGIAKGALAGGAGQALAQMLPIGELLGTAGGTALENAIDSGILGGAPTASGIAGLLQSASTATGIPSEVFTGAAQGAATAAITGGDPLQGAFTGAIGSGTGTALSSLEGFKDLDPAAQRIISNSAKGAATALATGRDPLDAAMAGGLSAFGSIIGSSTARTFPVAPAEQIDQTQLPTPDEDRFEQFLAGLDASAPTATEDWIDRAGLYEQPQTMDDFINNLLIKEASASTPTEDWIDRGGLYEQPHTPLEIEIAGTSGSTSTPTEDWIDRGGLGGEPGGAEELGVGATGAQGVGATGPSGGIGGLGGLLGGLLGGAGSTKLPATAGRAATGAGQPQGMDLLSMLALMNMQKQQAAPPPIPVVGEIKPYQFSTDLLEGLYPKPRMAQGGSTNDLMRIVRG